MIVGIFTEGLKNTYSTASLTAFSSGLDYLGVNNFISNSLKYKHCDIAVIFGQVRDAPHKIRRMRLKAEIIGRHIFNGLICIDTPVLLRCTSESSNYRRIGINGVFRNTGIFNNSNCNNSRFNKVENYLPAICDCEVSDFYLLNLQLPNDASIGGSPALREYNYFNWTSKVIQKCHDMREDLVIRIHPAMILNKDFYGEFLTKLQRLVGRFPKTILNFDNIPLTSLNTLPKASITFNSGSSIDTLLMGIPSIVFNERSFAWDVSQHEIKNSINRIPKLEQWLNDLAFVDWSIEEMKMGLPWLHLNKLLI